jgi:hypothetical protein
MHPFIFSDRCGIVLEVQRQTESSSAHPTTPLVGAIPIS